MEALRNLISEFNYYTQKADSDTPQRNQLTGKKLQFSETGLKQLNLRDTVRKHLLLRRFFVEERYHGPVSDSSLIAFWRMEGKANKTIFQDVQSIQPPCFTLPLMNEPFDPWGLAAELQTSIRVLGL